MAVQVLPQVGGGEVLGLSRGLVGVALVLGCAGLDGGSQHFTRRPQEKGGLYGVQIRRVEGGVVEEGGEDLLLVVEGVFSGVGGVLVVLLLLLLFCGVFFLTFLHRVHLLQHRGHLGFGIVVQHHPHGVVQLVVLQVVVLLEALGEVGAVLLLVLGLEGGEVKLALLLLLWLLQEAARVDQLHPHQCRGQCSM